MTAKLKNAPQYHNTVKACVFIFLVSIFSCKKENFEKVSLNSSNNSSSSLAKKPNIVLILMDDVGYEVPTYTGGQSYSTPTLDMLAQSNLQFSQCQAGPNCSPSRNMLMTGKYNFRNYIDWGILDTTQSTFANLLHDQGYATCIAGKWQMDGGDSSLRRAGFDRYRIWLPYRYNESSENWYRYKNPHLYQNAAMLPDSVTKGKYSEDMFIDYIDDFIDNNLTKPFLVYYTMSLSHFPYVPTPDDAEYASWTPESHKSNPKFYTSMVGYMDKKIQQVVNKINSSGLASNTIIIILGDNGTPEQVTSQWRGETVAGGKGSTTQFGTHVPMIVSWPGHIFPGTVDTNLVDLTDFLPTLANIAGVKVPASYGTIDGSSFYSAFNNNLKPKRSYVFCQWQSFTTNPVSPIHKWAQTLSYKLYDDSTDGNKFYNIGKDTLETTPLRSATMTAEEKTIKRQLQQVINNMHN